VRAGWEPHFLPWPASVRLVALLAHVGPSREPGSKQHHLGMNDDSMAMVAAPSCSETHPAPALKQRQLWKPSSVLCSAAVHPEMGAGPMLCQVPLRCAKALPNGVVLG